MKPDRMGDDCSMWLLSLTTLKVRRRCKQDSPPYLHDGRLLTLDDTVEFFNLISGTKLSEQEKRDVVAFMRQL